MCGKDSSERNADVGLSSEQAVSVEEAAGYHLFVAHASGRQPAADSVESKLMVVTTTRPGRPSYMSETASTGGSLVSNNSKPHMGASIGVTEETMDATEHQGDMGNQGTSDYAAISTGDFTVMKQETLNASSNFLTGDGRQTAPADPNVLQSSLSEFAAETKYVDGPPRRGDIEADLHMISDDNLDPGNNVALTDVYRPDSLGPLNLDIYFMHKKPGSRSTFE